MTLTNISVNPITPSAWLADARSIIEYFQKTGGDLPYVNSQVKRTIKCCAIPLLCLPCGLWSTVMRLLACPFMCCVKGVGFMCSDNGCTKLSDTCIAVAYNDAYEHHKLPLMPPIQMFTQEQKDELKTLVAPFISNAHYTSGTYRLEDAVGVSFVTLHTQLSS